MTCEHVEQPLDLSLAGDSPHPPYPRKTLPWLSTHPSWWGGKGGKGWEGGKQPPLAPHRPRPHSKPDSLIWILYGLSDDSCCFDALPTVGTTHVCPILVWPGLFLQSLMLLGSFLLAVFSEKTEIFPFFLGWIVPWSVLSDHSHRQEIYCSNQIRNIKYLGRYMLSVWSIQIIHPRAENNLL